ncbi:MAG: hypothetical protein Q7W05_03120 [Deltaproteobacteria bacterium]|nr:hypothetical protein [Deltaproteobacteria bacterium]
MSERRRALRSLDVAVPVDLAMKEQALGRLQESDAVIRRYKAPDSLVEFLKTL